MKNEIKEFKKFLMEKEVKIGKAVKESEITSFEKNYEVRFPKMFKEFFLEINGMPEYEMDGLTHLYTFEELHRAIDLLLSVTLPDYEIVDNKKVYKDLKSSLAEGESPLFTRARELNEGVELKILLAEPDQYFVFGDYNIGGGYWAINLNHNSALFNSVIIIYLQCDSYVFITDDFENFVNIYISDCPEALLWTL